jgi:hypothetical protein
MTTPSPSTQRFDESPASPSIYGSIPINPKSPNPNSVFSPGSPSPNSPMRRLSSFKKDRDLTLKRPQTSAIKGKTVWANRFWLRVAAAGSMVLRLVKFSSGGYKILRIGVMGRCQKVPKFDFQSKFSLSRIIQIFLIQSLLKSTFISGYHYFLCVNQQQLRFIFTFLGSPLQKRTRTLSRSSNPGSPAPPSPARSMPDSPLPPASPASPMPASPQKQVIVESGPVTPATPSEVSDIEDEDFEGKFC